MHIKEIKYEREKNTQLTEDGLQKVAGGILASVERLEYDRACGSFICVKCGRDYNHHKVESDD